MGRRGPFPIGRAGVQGAILLLFVLASVGSLGYLLFRIVPDAERSALEAWRSRLEAMAMDREVGVERWLANGERDARLLAGDPAVVDWLAAEAAGPVTEPAAGRFRSRFGRRVALLGYGEAWLLDARGRMLAGRAASGGPGDGTPEAVRAAAAGGPASVRLVRSGDGRSIVLFTAAVHLPTTTAPAGTVVLAEDAGRYLYPLLTVEPVPTRTGETLIGAREGDSILFLSPLRKVADPPLGVRRAATEATGLAITAALEGRETFREFEDYAGASILAVTRRLDGAPWGLVTKVDRAEALAGARAEVRSLALALLGLLAGLAGLAFGAWRLLRQQADRELRASERKYRSLFEDSRDPIFITAPDGRILDVNQATLDYFCTTRDEIARLNAVDFYADPADRARFRSAMEAEGSVSDFEVRLRARDGTERIGLYSATVVRDDKGAIQVYQGRVHDIPERRRAADALREANALLRALIDASPLAIIATDPELGVTIWNEAAEKLYGWPADEILGQDVMVLVPEEARAEYQRHREETARGAPPREVEVWRIRKDGSRFLASLSYAPIRGAAGESAGVMVVAADATERRALQDALARSEARFRSLIENASDLVAILRPDGSFLYQSPAIAHVLGYAPEELVGRNGLELVHPDDAAAVSAVLGAILENPRETRAVEYRYRHADGGWRVLESRGTNLLDDPGVAGIVVNSRDVTEKRRAEEEIREGRERLRGILETITDAVTLVNPAGEIVFANAAAERILGLTRSGITGRRYNDPAWRITGLDGGPFPDDELPFVRVMRTGQVVHGVEHAIEHPDGRRVILSINAAPLRGEAGALVGMVASFRDVTEKRRAEEAIRELNQTLEQRVVERTAELAAANRELEAFAYSVSHDLRAPLRALDGFSQAVLEDYGADLDETGRDYLSRIRAGSQRMGCLIDDLLTLSRINRGEIRREPVDLAALARESVGRLQAADPARQVAFVAPEGLPVRGDRRLLSLMVENLLSNAWKFTRTHERATIEVGVLEGAGRPVHFVRDDGVGFDMRYADKLFGAFQRLHPSGEFEGTGIGLATVQRIVHRHGGRIWAEAEPHRGATFYFTLSGESDA